MSIAPFNDINTQLGKKWISLGSVAIWIRAPEMHVCGTCHLQENNYKERYVETTYRLHEHKVKEW